MDPNRVPQLFNAVSIGSSRVDLEGQAKSGPRISITDDLEPLCTSANLTTDADG